MILSYCNSPYPPIIILMEEQQIGRKVVGKRLWSKEEDELLCRIVSRHGDPKWALVASEFNSEVKDQTGKTRTNKQCRERWQNHLNPILHNNKEWSTEQHKALLRLFRQHSHQWCVISSRLQGEGFGRRGDNHIKNYFYSSIKRAIKSINCVLRQSNKAIKKHKSYLYNYHEKYAYKKRLSLERQIMNNNNESTSHEQHLPLEHPTPPTDMRILKELDQDILSKILLIAEQKGSKKFALNNKDYTEEATTTRNTLIDYIQDPTQFQPEDIIKLTIKILELSRKCKRRTSKERESQAQFQSEAVSKAQQEKEQSSPVPAPPPKQSEQVKEQNKQSDLLQKFLIDESDSNNNQDNKKSQAWPHFLSKPNEQPSIFGFVQQSPKLAFEQSSSYLFLSNSYSLRNNFSYAYDMGNYPLPANNEPMPFPPPVDLVQKPQGNLQGLKFINSIKEIDSKQTVVNGCNGEFFDFGIMNNANANRMNPFMNGLFRHDSQQDRLFCSQVASLQKPSSHRSNKSSKSKGGRSDLMDEGMLPQQLIHRSWAYSSSRLEQCINLFSSNNFEQRREGSVGIDLRSSTLFPSSPNQE